LANKFSLQAIFSAVDKLSAPLAKMQGKIAIFAKGASRSLSSLDKRMGSIHGGLKSIATTTAAVGALGGLAAFSIGKAGAEFEQAITAVGAVSLQTRDQIADLEAEAKRLGATTQFTATQAANAMETMSRAGFTNAEILAGVGQVLSGAAAEGIEIAEMANHVSNALKGMGLETTETGRVVDVLALASARTNSSIGSLGESLANTASTARQFKIPLEDTVAAVALLQDVGLDASVAGSALNTMLTQMSAPTDSIAQKMKEFGVTFKDAQGNMLPFEQVLANISKAAKKSGGNMDQVAFMAELVGMRGEKAASNLSNLFDTGKVHALTEELRNAAGVAKKMAAIRMDNTIGDLTMLESAVDGIRVALFSTQSGPLRAMIQSMTKWVEVNKDLIIFEFQVWLRRITDNLPQIVTWLKRIGVAAVAFYTLWAAVKVAQVGIAAYEIVMKLATVATWAWKKATLAVQVAVKAAAAATWLYEVAIKAGQLATTLFTKSQVAAKIAQVALRVATIVGTAAQAAYALVVGTSTTALVAFKVGALASAAAIGAQVTAMAPLLLTLGVATAAVMALVAAWDQYNKLDKELEGSGGVTGTVGKMIDMGTWDPFEAHDAAMNEKARAAARDREPAEPGLANPRPTRDREQPQIISPQARAAAENAEATASASVDGTITVKAEPGTKATVKAKPKKVALDLQPSGAW
jgi:TP901 family phage tail tape measure protein